MSKAGWVALSVGPEGMRGMYAASGPKGSAEIQEWTERKWESAAGREGAAVRDLSQRTSEIQAFLRDLMGEKPARLRGMFCVHPSWVLVRKVTVPLAGKKETRQYLQLQVERQQSILRNGEISWGSFEAPPDPAVPGRGALLLMCKQETIKPVEEAFSACGLPVSLGTVSFLSDYALLKAYPEFSGRTDTLIMRVEPSGASLIEIRDRRIGGLSWISFGAETGDLRARFSLSALKFAELLRGREDTKIVLWGEARLRALAREYLTGARKVEEFDPASLPPGVSLGAGARRTGPEKFPSELAGLLMQQTSAAAGVNFVRPGFSIPAWGGRFRLLFEKKIAIPLAAVLLILLTLASVGGARLESRMYAETVGSSAKMAAGVRAAQKNVAVLERYSKERRPMLDILLDVTKALPNEVLVSNLKITSKDEVEITGNCQSLSVAEQLAANLNKSAFLTKASTERMSKGKQGMIFTIKCTLKKRGRN